MNKWCQAPFIHRALSLLFWHMFPAGYDFVRSTFRFRVFGDDLASRWHDGGLHRVLRSGLPVRITAGGPTWYGDPTPADEAELRHLLGMGFDLEGFHAAYPDVYARAQGFRPPLLADPFEMLVTAVTAQQVSLKAACRDPQSLHPAVRRAGRAGRFRVVSVPAAGARAPVGISRASGSPGPRSARSPRCRLPTWT